MTRNAFINGEFLPFSAAQLPINDRGLTLGDGAYEVIAVVGGKLVDPRAHLERLVRSLSALGIPNPYSIEQWVAFQEQLITYDALHNGVVYLQVSRGSSERDFAVPSPALTPNVVMFTQFKDIINLPAAEAGLKVITTPEIRWQRRDIKSISLAGAVLGKQIAAERGAQDVWFVEDGLLTEGGSANIFIVTQDDRLMTRDLSSALLGGITRAAILEIAKDLDIETEEAGFTMEAVFAAKEAFITSASTFLIPVIEVDGQVVGTGKPGPVAARLRAQYIEHSRLGGRLK